MTCPCGYTDDCDGEIGILYPLQEGGCSCATECRNPEYLPLPIADFPEDLEED